MLNDIPLIICAAGFGSRVFPASWGLCKELFPIDHRPALHHILDEAHEANIKNIILIISKYKESIRRYIEYREDQTEFLFNEKEKERLVILHELNKKFNYSILYQNIPMGVGNAFNLAREKILNYSGNYFAIAYPDDLYERSLVGLSDLIKISKIYNASCIALDKVPLNKISMYGVIDPINQINDHVYSFSRLVEKPLKKEAPSNLSVVGRYVLHKDLFIYFEKQKTDKPCFVKAMNDMMRDGYMFYGSLIQGKRFDIGNTEGWQKAVKHFAKKR